MAAAFTVDLSALAAGQKRSVISPTQPTTLTTEQQVDIKGDKAKSTLLKVQGTNDWLYKTTASGASRKVLAGVDEEVYVEGNTTFSIFVQRVAADGVLTVKVVG